MKTKKIFSVKIQLQENENSQEIEAILSEESGEVTLEKEFTIYFQGNKSITDSVNKNELEVPKVSDNFGIVLFVDEKKKEEMKNKLCAQMTEYFDCRKLEFQEKTDSIINLKLKK